MSITLVTLSGNVADLIGADFQARRTKVWIEANVDSFADLDNNVMRVGTATYVRGDGKGVINEDGTFAFQVVATGSADTNLEDPLELQYRLHVDYPRRSDNSHPSQAFGWYSVFVDSNVTDLEQQQKLEPSWQSDLASTVTPIVAAQVADAIASDGTVAAAAAAAVTANIAGRSLVERTDPGVPRTTVTDPSFYVATPTGLRKLDDVDLTKDNTLQGGAYGGVAYFSKQNVAGTVTEEAANQLSLGGEFLGDGVTDYPTELVYDKTTGKVPQFVLDRWASRMTGVGSGSPMDIIIDAGQSNATQRTTVPSPITEDWPGVMQWNGSPDAAPGTAWAVHSGAPWMGSAFARKWLREHAAPAGRKVGIIKAGKGSTGFSTAAPDTWDRTKAGSGTLYHRMISIATAALAAAPAGSRIIAVLWSQGENDRGDVASYAGWLDDLIATTRTALTLPGLPFVLGSLTPELARFGGTSNTPDPRVGQINGILEDTPRRLDNVSYVPGPPNLVEPASAGIHWATMGQIQRGEQMAGVGWPNAVMNVVDTTNLVAPQALAVARSGGTATLTWDHPPCKATAYTLETCTDGTGTTWTTETLPATLTHIFSKSVAAGTPLWARITTVQGASTSLPSQEARS